ncbi:MAG: carbohydrate ABC transporter permease [Clostridia bacterium]|nr:carbohydrate ABC transporter permease [Clostridia bacterium]
MGKTIITPDQHKIEIKKAKVWTTPQIILTIVILIFSLACLLPFVNVAAVSLSSKSAILRGKVTFWPVEFETTAYKAIFADSSMIRSLVLTIIMTIVYTAISMAMTILMAYPLTKKRLHGRKFFSLMALFTMYFSGGIIPHYLNIRDLGLMDNVWSLILPCMLSTYYMIILKSFFQSLPNELEEAAIIDGATDFQVLWRIYLPLSMASLATLTLFYAVYRWNGFQDALYYINTKSKQPLQLKLYNIIKGAQAVDVAAMEGGSSTVATSVSESIRPATIIFATMPILVVYPFVQRYFVAGVTIGAVKG